MRFSTEWLPERDRLAIWREEFGQRFVRLDVDQLDDDPLLYDATFMELGGLSVCSGRISAISCSRTRTLLQDGNDDIVLLVPLTDRLLAQQGAVDEIVAPGQCLVRRSSEVGSTHLRPGHFLTLNLPMDGLAERVSGIDRLGLGVLPGDTEAMALLAGNCNTLLQMSGALAHETRTTTREHILDLASLVIGASRDSWHAAQDRGVRAARLQRAKAEIRKHASDPAFSTRQLAQSMDVSESYIRKLLAADGTTVTALLRDARLEMALRLLRDARFQEMQISQIAFECGFSDISYFNRSFRQRYDMAPSDARRPQ